MRIKCQKAFLAGALAVSLASLQAQAALIHRYSFTETTTQIKDSVGTAHGTLNSLSPQFNEGAVYLNILATATKPSSDPTGDYISFPTDLLAGKTNITIDFWFKGGFLNIPTVPTWSRVWDFGSSANNNGVNYMFYTAHSGSADHRFVVQSGVGEQTVLQAGALEGDPTFHVTTVFDFTTHYMELYKDGVQVARSAINVNANPTNINYQNVCIGRSNYRSDPYFVGAIDEFRIYDHSLSAPEIMAAQKAGVNVINPSVSTLLGSASAMTFLQGGTNQNQASLMERSTIDITPVADFSNGTETTTAVPLFRTAGLTLTSSDSTIATVTEGGRVRGEKPGTTTITASYGGKMATFTVTVTNDITAPTVTSVSNAGYNRLFNIVFSKALNTNSAETLSNYTIDGGTIKVQSATLLANNTVRLYTDTFDIDLPHTVTISGVQDMAFTPNTVASTNFTVGSVVTVPANGMTWKIWTNITSWANWRAASNARFPNSPDGSSFLTNAESFAPTGTNNYACVWQAYFVPTNTGNHWFSIATDDEGELFVSTNDNPSFVGSAISTVGTWVGNRSFANQISKAPIYMVAGQKYYMQLNFHQASGGDNAAIAFAMTNSIPNNSLPIPGEMLIPYVHKPIPMSIAAQSGDTNMYQGQDASFFVTVGAVPAPTSYQWYRNGQAISGATTRAYSLRLITKSNDDQATFYCVVSNLVDCVTSAPVKLGVTIDLVPPSVTKLTGSAGMDRVLVQFTKRMDASTVNDKANFTITGLTIYSNALDSTLSNLVIYTSKQTAKQLHTVTMTIANIKDVAGNKLTNSTYTFNAFDAAAGFTFVRFYHNYTASVDDLYAYSLTNEPTRVAVYNDFGTLNFNDPGIQNFGGIAEGYITAPENGEYIFALASDDNSRFFLSTNDMPSGIQFAYLTSVSGFTGYNEFGKYASQQARITLVGGQRYFYRLCWTQGGGGAGFHVAWASPSDWEVITNVPAAYYSASGDPTGAAVTITKDPTSVTVMQGGKATFSVAATGTSTMGTNVTYQWRKNGVAIPGATGTNYTVALANLPDNGAVYDCVAALPFASATSSGATLTVTPDTVKPVVLSAGAFPGSTQVGVRFSKPVTPAASSLTYTIDGNSVLGVAFRTNSMLDGTNGDMVVLTLNSPIVSGKSVTVSGGFVDRWGNVGLAATVPVEICTMTAVDVGNLDPKDPLFVGSTVPTGSNSFQLIGGGSDIWLGTDACQYVYMPFSGNFDARARVANVSQANTWSKSGLMVRATTNGPSTMAANLVTPSTGQNVYAAHYRTIASSNAVDFAGTRPGNLQYPNVWVRLTRQGQNFSVWSSTDNTNWIQHGTANLTAAGFQNEVLVGVALTAHDNTSATASYAVSDVYDFSVKTYEPKTTALKIDAVYTNGNVVVSWDAVLGEGYILQWKGAIDAAWNNTSQAPTIVDGRAIRNMPTTDGIRFYRLVWQ